MCIKTLHQNFNLKNCWLQIFLQAFIVFQCKLDYVDTLNASMLIWKNPQYNLNFFTYKCKYCWVRFIKIIFIKPDTLMDLSINNPAW